MLFNKVIQKQPKSIQIINKVFQQKYHIQKDTNFLNLIKKQQDLKNEIKEEILIQFNGKSKLIKKGTTPIDLINELDNSTLKEKGFICKVNEEIVNLNRIIQSKEQVQLINKNILKELDKKDEIIKEKILKNNLEVSSLISSLAILNSSFGKQIHLLRNGKGLDNSSFFIDLIYFNNNNDDFKLNFLKEELEEIQININNLLDNSLIELKQTYSIQLNDIQSKFYYFNNNNNNNNNNINLIELNNDEYFLLNNDLIIHPNLISIININKIELIHSPVKGQEHLQNTIRIHLSTFLNKKEQLNYEKGLNELKKRDHRNIGKQQQLFLTHIHSPGAPFFLPNGVKILNQLKQFLRQKYEKFQYQEVATPLLFKKELFEISGHWQNYKEDMFQVMGCCSNLNNEDENEIIGLKPMNCPAHCLIFDSIPRNFNDLPLRLADFGTLHRNEASGALTGLTRVRQFHQDDGHIFCRYDQINQEIRSTLTMLKEVYQALELPNYQLTLSTRPETHFIGTEETWASAELQLKEALEATGQPWSIKPGDGAFYGPKIDIMVQDAFNRFHQTATIQLDFQLPERFKLSYKLPNEGTERPVIIHRAIFGSLERMFAILMEHHMGRWPFWLNPNQVIILPLPGEQLSNYGKKILNLIQLEYFKKYHLKLNINLDTSGKSLSSMVKQAQLKQFNFMIILGEKELESNCLSLRDRDGKVINKLSIEQILDIFYKLQEPYL